MSSTSPPADGAATIEVVHGSMFGGKTEHMIKRLREATAAGKRVAAFKHCIDDRYAENEIVTHAGDRFEAINVPDTAAILEKAGDYQYVAIDEGHFFGMTLVETAQALKDRGISVLVAGITFDAWGRPFDPMPQVCAIADEETIRRSACTKCGQPAEYTQRMTEVNTQHMVGGVNDYEPRCQAHFEPLKTPPEER